FIQVLETVRERHPDASRLDYDRLVNHALDGMLQSLDPHSSFLHPEMAAAAGTEGPDPHLQGLGITLGKRDGELFLVAVDDHSPADAAEMRPGDVLISINGSPVADLDLEEAVARFS